MSREIKFRAWMIAGKYMKQWEGLEHLNFWAYANHGGIWELMQYTGLKDKNGKEIYEGDIIQVRQGFVSFTDVVEFRDAEFLFKHQDQFDNDTSLLPFVRDGEIIGNIYSNPELLKT